MARRTQTINDYFRLGPKSPESDPWFQGVYDSACHLYNSEDSEGLVQRQLAPQTAPIIKVGDPLPDPLLLWQWGIVTPPCDRFVLSSTQMIPAVGVEGFSAATSLPSPWTIVIKRGLACQEEATSNIPSFKYQAANFLDCGNIVTVYGSPLPTGWVITAYQLYTPGTDVALTMRINVKIDRIGCCPEGFALGPNSSEG